MECYYVNSRNEIIDFIKNDKYSIPNIEQLFGYTYGYNSVDRNNGKRKISNFFLDNSDRQVTVSFMCDNEEDFSETVDSVNKVLLYDVNTNNKGRLYVNDSYLECFFASVEYQEYEHYFDSTDIVYTLVVEDAHWLKETEMNYFVQDNTEPYVVDVETPIDSVNYLNNIAKDMLFETTVYGDTKVTNIGKNLWQPNVMRFVSNTERYYANYVPAGVYTISRASLSNAPFIYYKDGFNGQIQTMPPSQMYTTWIVFNDIGILWTQQPSSLIQLEKGVNVTSFEMYKANILSANDGFDIDVKANGGKYTYGSLSMTPRDLFGMNYFNDEFNGGLYEKNANIYRKIGTKIPIGKYIVSFDLMAESEDIEPTSIEGGLRFTISSSSQTFPSPDNLIGFTGAGRHTFNFESTDNNNDVIDIYANERGIYKNFKIEFIDYENTRDVVTIGKDKSTLIKKYNYIDLGSLTWTYNGSYYESSVISDIKKPSNITSIANIITNDYDVVAENRFVSIMQDKTICLTQNKKLLIKEDFIKNNHILLFKDYVARHLFVYEMESPSTYEFGGVELKALGNDSITSYGKVSTKYSYVEDSSEMLDYPYDHPYDYTQLNSNSFIDNDDIIDADFRIVIYGHCINPTLYIGEKCYTVNVTVNEKEYLTIDSLSKKIYITDSAGNVTNVFSKRGRKSDVGNDIFDKIPVGRTTITWDKSFKFDITLINSRSEPKWI